MFCCTEIEIEILPHFFLRETENSHSTDNENYIISLEILWASLDDLLTTKYY